MIYDSLKNCELYYGVNKKFEKSFDFIKKAIAENLPNGRYEIDGDEIYAMVDGYPTRHEENCRFEAHRKYIDIQCLTSGYEVMKSVNVSKIVTAEAYDENRDVEFFESSDEACASTVADGEFVVFYPEDAHMPGIAYKDVPMDIKKVIIKIKV